MRKAKDGHVPVQDKAVQHQKRQGLSRCTDCLYYFAYDFNYTEESYVCEFRGMILKRRVFNNGCVHGVSWRKTVIFPIDKRLCGAKGCLRLIDEAMRSDHGMPDIAPRRDTEKEEVVSRAVSEFEKARYNPETGAWGRSWLKWYQILGKTFRGNWYVVCRILHWRMLSIIVCDR